MDRFVILSGCSGGGKSTLLAALAERGYATIEEPGRRIVAEETAREGTALPWIDLAAFARRAMHIAIEDRQRAGYLPGLVFFDRGLVDAAAALHHATGEDVLSPLVTAHRYNNTVFLTPPWPEIFAGDDARRHGLTDAIAEYDRLVEVYAKLGYEVAILPKAPVGARVEYVLDLLRKSASARPKAPPPKSSQP
jgi:predicted ATPase